MGETMRWLTLVAGLLIVCVARANAQESKTYGDWTYSPLVDAMDDTDRSYVSTRDPDGESSIAWKCEVDGLNE